LRIKDWGLHLDSIRLQDIEMPEDMKRIMSRQAVTVFGSARFPKGHRARES
jgi:hypothetical protein